MKLHKPKVIFLRFYQQLQNENLLSSHSHSFFVLDKFLTHEDENEDKDDYNPI